ncbi:MAG: hypothetical protein A2X03_09980 [Bacteroidetes bacterium GWA2_40_15]|nr:MAG: hypothetical protein A2X03_09980 [Bacteroidetes bacterium GWA2_40_15]OFX87069.1 MAG: hypothetical protein A2X06_03345 [Bacteroidetes bacterium GWC2_40_22]HBH82636.1 hypothetical protein [Bacteroidales bacterium]HBQ82153.1 hypothetical protein [Bacteroidales bacterium]
MKNLFCFLIGIIPFSVFAQNKSNFQRQIDSLNSLRKEYQNKIETIDGQIKDLDSKKTIAQFENVEGLDYYINQQLQIKIRDKASSSGKVIFEPKNGMTIKLIDFIDVGNYWLVSINNKIGYVSEVFIQANPIITEFKKNLLTRKAQAEKDRINSVYNARRNRLVKAYGIETANKILMRQYWIGMTSDMDRESLGNPDDVNSSNGSWGVHEQWVYEKEDLFLYFENGKLTSWQE